MFTLVLLFFGLVSYNKDRREYTVMTWFFHSFSSHLHEKTLTKISLLEYLGVNLMVEVNLILELLLLIICNWPISH